MKIQKFIENSNIMGILFTKTLWIKELLSKEQKYG